MTVPTIDLPPFYCPIESAVHPDVDRVEQRCLAWIDRIGFCASSAERASALGSDSADFYARFAPCADPERLWIAACWVYWGFAFDDAHCDDGELSRDPGAFADLAGRVQRALETPGPYESGNEGGGGSGPRGAREPYAVAVHDIGERFRACSTPVQMRRFHQAHRGWLTGVQWQIGNLARGRMPSLDDYIAMRLHSAGGEPTYAMLELANGAEVPGAEMDSPAVCALTEMAILVAALDNDRHSFARESRGGEATPNLFTALAHQEGIAVERAVGPAVALRDGVLCRFLTLRERVLPRASQELRRYLVDLGHGIRGNAEWGQRVPRYRGADGSAGAPPACLEWAERPSHTVGGPPPLPSVAWWWDDELLP